MATRTQKPAAPATATMRANTRSQTNAGRWLWLGVAVAIALVAFAVRVWTVRRGLPYVDHPDEPNPIDYVVGMLRTGDMNPHAFQKPSLYIYLVYAVLAAHYRWGVANGLYGDLNQMLVTTHLYTTLPEFFFWGRVLTSVIGAVSVLAVFVVARRLWSTTAGIAGALFLAASPFHLRHSQYVTTDVTSALFVLLSFFFAALIVQPPGRVDDSDKGRIEHGRWRMYLLAGLFAGFAASTKYNVGVAVLPIAAAHVLFWRWQSLRQLPRLLAAGVAAITGFIIGTPYALLSFDEFRSGIFGQVGDYSKGEHGDFVGAWNWGGYADWLRSDEWGLLAATAVVIGLLVLLWQKPKLGLLWFSFAVPFVLLHVSQGSHFMRNMVPLAVLAVLPVGVAVAALFEATKGERQKTKDRNAGVHLLFFIFRLAAAATLLALLWLPAQASWAHNARLARGDTRVQALAWIDRNLVPGTRIAAELRPIPGPIESRWSEVASLLPYDLAWYRQQGYSYIIATSDAWRQWDMPAAYGQYAQQPPIAQFGGATAREMLGPRVVVYATGLSAADVPQPLSRSVQIGGAQLLGIGIGRPNGGERQVGITPAQIFKPGEILGLRTFWQVEASFDHDYLIYVHVLDANGATVAQRDAPPWQGLFPTTTWRVGSSVVDFNDVALPATLPPGEYRVVVGMYSPELNAHPPMTEGGDVEVATIVVQE